MAYNIKYYINGVLQDYTPTLPISTETLKISNTAIIGYPDTVDTIKRTVEAWSIVWTAQEVLDKHNALQ